MLAYEELLQLLVNDLLVTLPSNLIKETVTVNLVHVRVFSFTKIHL